MGDAGQPTIETFTDLSQYLAAISGKRDISMYRLELPAEIVDEAAAKTTLYFELRYNEMEAMVLSLSAAPPG